MAVNHCADNDNVKEPTVPPHTPHPNVLRNLGLFQSSVGHWALRVAVKSGPAIYREPFLSG